MRRVLSLVMAGLLGMLNAQEITISDVEIDALGNLHLNYEGETDFYYLLVRGNSVEEIKFAVDADIGQSGTVKGLADLETGLDTSYYRVIRIPNSQPYDTDGDGIDDVVELSYDSFLDPLDVNDARRDFDRDGISNVDEIRNGTDPTAFDGVQIFAPLSGTSLELPTDIAIVVESGPGIQSVDFYEGENLLGTDSSWPFRLDWESVPAGDYQLTVVGQESGGGTTSSLPVPVSVNHPPGQFIVAKALTNEDSVMVTGTVIPDGTVTITGGSEVVSSNADPSGAVSIDVPLIQNRENRLYAVVTDSNGRDSPPVPMQVIQDSEPPNFFIDFPEDGTEVTIDSVTVAGRVGDMLSGHEGLSVDVEGTAAEVIVGIGQNGTFERQAVALADGLNFIDATAMDAAGNTTVKRIVLNKINTNGPRLEVISGDGQYGVVQQPLAAPLVVRVLTEDNTPVPNKLVTFEIVRSDGLLKQTNSSGEKGGLILQVVTDVQGVARALLTLGTDAGCGNNRVKVSSRDVAGTVFFCETALPDLPSQINIGSGNRLKVEAGSMAQEPLRVWVNDSCNGVGNIPVTFRVVEGGGLVNGSPFVVIDTAITGHAEVEFQLGPTAGNNRIEADFPGNPGNPAVFVIEGVARDASQPTRWKGLVLDNARQPIGGAACSLEIEGVDTWSTFTDSDGTFSLVNIPSGPGRLVVNGRTATMRGGEPVPEGSFPSLYYEVLAVPNAENSLPGPVMLPLLDPANDRFYDGTEDVVLEVAGMSGLKMTVAAGSMTRADGTVPSPEDPEWISLNQVHHDDIPMPMPDGAAPPFAWTVQPFGAHFDPPIQIEYPNMSSLQPGAIAYFLSYDHDTERFEIVASGHVTNDGSTIVTDPGVGLTVAGWGCNCPPYSVTGDCTDNGPTKVRDPKEDPPETGTRTRKDGEEEPGPNEGDCVVYCVDSGQINMGSFTNPATIACPGQILTFNGPSFTDTGGAEEEACRNADGSITKTLMAVPAVPVNVTWTIRRNGIEVSQGTGTTASIMATAPGTYSCVFTGTADRNCPPASKSSPGLTALVVSVASVSGGGVTSTSSSIGPSNTVYICETETEENLTLTATSSVGGIWPPGEPTWTGANGSGPTATLPISSASASPNGTIVTVSCGTSSKSMRVIVVKAASVSGEGVTSTTDAPGDDETIYVCQGMPGDTISLTATASPANVWPANEPTWIGAVSNGATATVPIHNISSTSTGELVTVRCGGSEVSIGVVVVGVKSVETDDPGTMGKIISMTDDPGDMETVRVCVGLEGDTITLTAKPTPGTVWPDGAPTWENATATGNGDTATFPIDTVSADAEGTIVKAICGESEKAIRVVVYDIEKVEWIAKDSPLDANPNPGGGLRIFPEKATPAAEVKDVVLIRATVTPVIDKAKVYFKKFDVDDPSSNAAPVDNEERSFDNRDYVSGPDSDAQLTNAEGYAEVEFTVSHRPGDNYRAVALCDPKYFPGMGAKQNDGTLARVHYTGSGSFFPARYISPLLTVWRTLHVELDSMLPVVPEENMIKGNITALFGGTGTAADAVQTDQEECDSDRFENGEFKIGAPAEITYAVDTEIIAGSYIFALNGRPAKAIVPLSFSAEDNDFAGNSTMSGTVTEIVRNEPDNPISHTLTLNITANSENPIDWPDFVGGTISVGGGAAVAITAVDSGAKTVTVGALSIPFELTDDDSATMPYLVSLDTFVNDAYSEAYVRVFNDGGGTPTRNKQTVPFQAHIPDECRFDITANDIHEAIRLPNAMESDGDRSDGYWIGYALLCYQSAHGEDNDSDAEAAVCGWNVDPIMTKGGGALIMVETILDCKNANSYAWDLTKLTQATITHEIGHQFGLGHDHGHIMDKTGSNNEKFAPEQIDKIRNRVKSPGK